MAGENNFFLQWIAVYVFERLDVFVSFYKEDWELLINLKQTLQIYFLFDLSVNYLVQKYHFQIMFYEGH